ncbi:MULTISPECIES: GNAT family N-acetyltransferase [unclassified Carboxylicivirga]|uniref:GNAT family N-acetyltransferase n=1 Tax=Carboxylicivirga TaxID=1628153 RepID=UPI003D35930B
MERLLIYVKHKFPFLWNVIDWFNNHLFSAFFKSIFNQALENALTNINPGELSCRELRRVDLHQLYCLINSQDVSDLKYFKPHGFDMKSLEKQFSKSAFLMMGVFDKNTLVGYFFLRLFINKKCFVGRLTDRNYRGKGLGKIMNKVMYELAWQMNFRCLSTISQNNKAVMQAHSKNSSMKVLKKLSNDYLLVEFVQNSQ